MLLQVLFLRQVGTEPVIAVERRILDHSLRAASPLEEDIAGIPHLHHMDPEVEDQLTGFEAEARCRQVKLFGRTGLAAERSIGREVAGRSFAF